MKKIAKEKINSIRSILKSIPAVLPTKKSTVKSTLGREVSLEELIKQKDVVIEAWYSDGLYYCLASRGVERPPFYSKHGTGKTLINAVTRAIDLAYEGKE